MVNIKGFPDLRDPEELTALTDRELEEEMDKLACELSQVDSSLYIGGRLCADVEQLLRLKTLKYLDLSSTGIDCIEGLKSCESLVYLDLSDNNITDLKHIENLKRLKFLNLKKNRISVIENLENLTELEELNISENHLGHRSNGYCQLYNLMFCKKLKILHIEKNFIREEVISDFTQFDSLRELYFKPNPVIGDYETYRLGFVFFLNQLNILDGSHITNEEFAESCVFIRKRYKAMQEIQRIIQEHLYGNARTLSFGRRICKIIYYTSIILVVLPIILDPAAFIAALIEGFKG